MMQSATIIITLLLHVASVHAGPDLTKETHVKIVGREKGLMSGGAYGFIVSSHDKSPPPPEELFIEGGAIALLPTPQS